MSIGVVTANNLPAVYKRKALEDEEMLLIEVGRTKLKVPYDTFAAVSNALATFAPDGKATMEPGWTVTLKDEFSGRSTTVTAHSLLFVMQSLATFAVKRGVYIPEIPPIEEAAPADQKAEPKKRGRKKAGAAEKADAASTAAETPPVGVETAKPARRGRKASQSTAVEPVQAETAPPAASQVLKPARKAGRPAKARKADEISAPAPVEAVTPAASSEPTAVAEKPKRGRAAKNTAPATEVKPAKKGRGRPARLSDAKATEVVAATPEVSIAETPKKPGRRKKAEVATQPATKSKKVKAEKAETVSTPAAKPMAPQPAAKAPAPKSRKLKTEPTAAATQAGQPLTVPDYTGGPLPKALVSDHAKPAAAVKGKGIPSYMSDYKMAYLLEGGEYRFDYTPLQINPKSRRKVLGIPTDPNATTVPGYEIKSNGDHIGWIIVEEKMLFAIDLPNSRDGHQAAAKGSVEGIIRKILFGVVPAVQKIRKAA